MKELLEEAIREIERLRRQNEILSAKVDTMNLLGVLLHTSPGYSSSPMSPDITWTMRNAIKELEREEIQPPVPL